MPVTKRKATGAHFSSRDRARLVAEPISVLSDPSKASTGLSAIRRPVVSRWRILENRVYSLGELLPLDCSFFTGVSDLASSALGE